jgi:CHAT domain-containing protein
MKFKKRFVIIPIVSVVVVVIVLVSILIYLMRFAFLGSYYHARGDYAKAEIYFLKEKAFNEYYLDKWYQNNVVLLISLGVLYINIGDYARAENYLLEAEAIWDKALSKEHKYYYYLFSSMGMLYLYRGDYVKAESYLLEAEAILGKKLVKKHPYYTNLISNLGGLYLYRGDYDKAESYLLESETIWRKKQEAIWIKIVKAILRKKQVEKHWIYACLLNDIGEMYHGMGDNTKAEKYYLEAIAIKKKALGKEHLYYVNSLSNLGGLYNDMGDYDKAKNYLLEVEAIWEKKQNKEHPYYAASLNNLGLLYVNMGDYDKAEKYCLEAITISEKALGKEHPNSILYLDSLSELFLTVGDHEQSLVYKKEANKLNKTLIDRFFTFFSEKEREAYWNMRSSTFEKSYSLSWFYPVPESYALNYDTALFSKGLLLRTTNAIRDSVYSSGDQSMIEQYDEFRHLRQRIGALRQGRNVDEEYIQKLVRQADALEKSILEEFIAQASAPNKEIKADLALSWEDVRNSLQTGEAAIEFVSFNLFDKKWTGNNNYAALVLRHGMETPAFIPLCEETALAELFTKLDGKAPREQARILYEENGPSLYSLVWQPLEKILEGVKAVYYSPSGLLYKLSLNAIPVKGNVLLSSIYDLNLVSSTREIARRNIKTAGKPSSAVLYGGLVYDTDTDKQKQESKKNKNQRTRINLVPPEDIKRGSPFPHLVESFQECWKIQQRFSMNNIPADLYNKERGNEESFKNMDGKKINVIHLSTHGIFKDDIEKNYGEKERIGDGKKALENPLMRSYLALAGANNSWNGKAVESVEDGILYADDIANINLAESDLVVLSACDTALGVVNNSEGVFGLQRAFKLAGAETIVMSLWKVDDKATSDLMERFYRNWLSNGMGKQEAFKKAQGWLREKYSSPYFWAAFVMMD